MTKTLFMMKKYSNWLIISHGFNMDGRAASLTITDKMTYILNTHIKTTVLSAITGEKDNRFDHYQLLPLGPAGLRFDFRHWVAKRYGRGLIYKILTPLVSFALLPFTALEKLLIGLSSQSSWSYAAARKGKQLIRSRNIDLIYSSGGAWSAHYAAWMIKKATGKKWIAEIHDPMIIRDDPKDDGTAPRKTRDKRFQQKLEHLICRDADHVWWFTDGALDYAKLRNPVLGDKGFVVFPGAEPPGCHEPLPEKHQYSNQLTFGHFGSIATDRSLAPVLDAMKIFFQDHPEAEQQIRIQVYGSALDSSSKEAIERTGLGHIVQAMGRVENDPVTGKSGRARIMEIMRQMDVLLLLHGDYEWCAEYIPSKTYDYYWTARPIWGITNRNPQLDAILENRQSYLSHTLEQDTILKTLEVIWADWQKQQLRSPVFDPVSPKQAVEAILKRIQS
jgi:hypothetical protein